MQLGAVVRVCASKEWAVERCWSRAILSKARGDHIESQHEQKCLNLAQRERERYLSIYIYLYIYISLYIYIYIYISLYIYISIYIHIYIHTYIDIHTHKVLKTSVTLSATTL